MNSPLLFIPPALSLLVACVGLLCLAAAWLISEKLSKVAAKPVTPPVIGPAVNPSGCRPWLIKALGGAGILAVLLGGIGLWSAKPSITWNPDPARSWSDGTRPGLEALIRARCVPFMKQGHALGMAVAVVTPTNSAIVTFGYSSFLSRHPIQPDTQFEIGSITKTFTGLALARQIEKGPLHLEQTLEQLLPPDVTVPEKARKITLRHLTTHTSGLPRVAGGGVVLGALKMLLFGSDPYAGFGEAELWDALRTVQLESEPGTQSSYSNFGMMLLGHLLARRAECSYETLIQREICEPLRMTNTCIQPSQRQPLSFAQGYRAMLRLGPVWTALRSAPWFQANPLGGAGALRSTVSDMLKYLQANMQPENAPIAHALRETHRELFKSPDGSNLGMNWIRTQRQSLNQTLIWHNGGTGGFRSFIGWAETSGVGVVLLSNSSESVDDLAGDLLRDLAALDVAPSL